MEQPKFIHLLYVPTMACNMQCKYCYLEDNTKDEDTKYTPIETLKYAVDKLKKDNIVPFNISLHGGEVTALSKNDFEDLIKFISNYYNTNKTLIESNNFKVGKPHIKTNLYDLDKHLETIKKYNVSISGSLDLPFSLHDKFRVTKAGKSTLQKILQNIQKLSELPNSKKVSATIFKEHFELIDEIINDIKFLNENTPLDMNDFNFMIGFDYNSNGLLTPLTENEQVEFFNRMHTEFDNTNLDKGVNGAWFNEFGPEYCTNCDNCGEKFFLLERNGDIYSCVRGQKHKEFYYGNIYKDSVERIMQTARIKIFNMHNQLPFNEECANCGYLYLCKTGCPFVKNVYKTNKSYTCKLQQELYKNRNYEKKVDGKAEYDYISKMHPDIMEKYIPKANNDDEISLENLIKQDSKLKYIYDEKSFLLKVDEQEYWLKSQILKNTRDILYITPETDIKLYIRKNILEEQSLYPQNNSLYIMLLSGDLIKYGDEGRIKQKHVMTHQVFKNVLEQTKSEKDGFYCFDLKDLLYLYRKYISKENPNNIFFTTSDLRDYHYTKQKNNAYYHIKAINLPFQNIEFYYLDMEQ